MDQAFRTYHEVGGPDRSDLPGQLDAQASRVRDRLASVAGVLGVMSGKGGVGKSLIAAGLAGSLNARGARVGLLDADLASPTAMPMCGLSPRPLRATEGSVEPLRTATGMSVMSTGAVLPEGAPLEWTGPSEGAFAWRGAQERTALREMLVDVEWGELDWLVVDLPPGTHRLLDLADFAEDRLSVLAVTIPSEASRTSVARALSTASDRGIRVQGIVENMSGYVCGACGQVGPLHPGNAADSLAATFSLPVLGRLPFDPLTAVAAERGEIERMGTSTPAGEALLALAERLQSGTQQG